MRTHVDIFTGLAGFALAARANGVRTIAMCEIDPRCRAFLAKAWPGIQIWDDVRTFRLGDSELYGHNGSDEHRSLRDTETKGRMCEPKRSTTDSVWLLTAGVPCQPSSRAGKQRGAADDRWLWEPALAVLADLIPTWALFENPPGIGDVGLAGILSQVGALGYEVRVFGIPACAVGAPHRRERYWIVAHRDCERFQEQRRSESIRATDGESEFCGGGDVAHREVGTLGTGLRAEDAGRERRRRSGDGDGERMAYAGCPEQRTQGRASSEEIGGKKVGRAQHDYSILGGCADPWADAVWMPCADGKVRRAPGDAFGLVDGLHRSILAALGNSIVPQVAQRIIAAMIEAEEEAT